MTNEKKIFYLAREIQELRTLRTEINEKEEMLDLFNNEYRTIGKNILGAVVHLEHLIIKDAVSIICEVGEINATAALNTLYDFIEQREQPTVEEISAKVEGVEQ